MPGSAKYAHKKEGRKNDGSSPDVDENVKKGALSQASLHCGTEMEEWEGRREASLTGMQPQGEEGREGAGGWGRQGREGSSRERRQACRRVLRPCMAGQELAVLVCWPSRRQQTT